MYAFSNLNTRMQICYSIYYNIFTFGLMLTVVLTREQAWEKLNELIENRNLIKHCLAVEAAMLAYAEHFAVPEPEREKWAIAGLIHDADWEKYPQQHPQIILKWLAEQDADHGTINAIAAHGYNFGVQAKTQLAKTLRAIDELTGLIVAVTLVRPSKKLADVTIEAVLNKWNVTSFARGVKRKDIERGAKEINMPLRKHIEIVLAAMQRIAPDLGL